MDTFSSPSQFLPILLMFLVALGFVVTTMVASHTLGPKKSRKLSLIPLNVVSKVKVMPVYHLPLNTF